MKQVNQFILETYSGQHYIEKAKREECWEQIKNHSWAFNINEITADMIDENNTSKRNAVADFEDSEEARKYEENIICSIPFPLWEKIEM